MMSLDPRLLGRVTAKRNNDGSSRISAVPAQPNTAMNPSSYEPLHGNVGNDPVMNQQLYLPAQGPQGPHGQPHLQFTGQYTGSAFSRRLPPMYPNMAQGISGPSQFIPPYHTEPEAVTRPVKVDNEPDEDGPPKKKAKVAKACTQCHIAHQPCDVVTYPDYYEACTRCTERNERCMLDKTTKKRRNLYGELEARVNDYEKRTEERLSRIEKKLSLRARNYRLQGQKKFRHKRSATI